MHTTLVRAFAVGVALGLVSCGGVEGNGPSSTGGSNSESQSGGSGGVQGGGSTSTAKVVGGTGGQVTGGASGKGGSNGTPATATGGGSNPDTANGTAIGGESAMGGTAAGGAAVGGKSAMGGTAAGGAAVGGKSATGGAAAGGAATGGVTSAAGSFAFGGTGTGGAASGGNSAAGGAAVFGGNSASGGAGSGGEPATGGAAMGGTGTTSTTRNDPCSIKHTLSGGTPHCDQNTYGSYGDHEWQLWSNQPKGKCLITYDATDAAFSASWEDSGNLLATVGLVFDGTKTYQELGVFSAEFAETRAGSAGDYSYIGILGWMASPSVEFYIVEDSFDPLPIKPIASDKLSTIHVDGGDYDVYSAPLTGTNPTIAVFSVRRTSRNCGHISISEHFSQWTQLGIALGKVLKVNLFVEAGGGEGNLDFTTASVVLE